VKRCLVAAAFFALSALFVMPSPAAAQGWGTVRGKVTWAGAIPAPEKINVDQDQKHCLKDGPLFKETFVINAKNKGVKNVFVWLAPADKDSRLPVHPDLQKVPAAVVVIDQPCCAFVPHAVAMREGQTVEAKNSAPVPHNFKWSGHPLKNPGGNQIIPPGGKLLIDNLKADRLPISVGCDIHKWMTGYIRVFDHPYFAVTDANGRFEIKNAPAGNWRLIAWQEGVGWVNAGGKNGEPITVNAGKDTSVQLQVKAAP
jgi:hypothetical protein